MTAAADLDELLVAWRLTVVRTLRDTTSGRTLAVQGEDGTMTIVKAHPGADPHAVARHDTELAVYRALHTVPPVAWNTRTLLAADESTLTLRYLPGAPITDGRYPGAISDHRIRHQVRCRSIGVVHGGEERQRCNRQAATELLPELRRPVR